MVGMGGEWSVSTIVGYDGVCGDAMLMLMLGEIMSGFF